VAWLCTVPIEDDGFKTLVLSHNAPCDVISAQLTNLTNLMDLKCITPLYVSLDRSEKQEYSQKEKKWDRVPLTSWFLQAVILKSKSVKVANLCHIYIKD